MKPRQPYPAYMWRGGRLSAAAILSACFAVSLLPTVATAAGWEPDPAALTVLAARGTSWIYHEKDVPRYTLPDPLARADRQRITTAREWEQTRRPEILELFRQQVYGRAPAKPEKVGFEIFEKDPAAIAGRATLKRVRITVTDQGKTFSFPLALLTPNGVAGPVPAFVLINHRKASRADPTRKKVDPFWPAEDLIQRGYAAVVFQADDVDLDKPGDAARVHGVRAVWDGPGKAGEDRWATLSAWAWGASRVMDYLQTDPAIDAAKVAVVGHSRGGKASLWAGAQDERFALIISNESGHGGASLSRRRFGETVAAINQGYPYWFCANYTRFNGREDELPVDQHELIALIAPRAVYVASADYDFWSDQRGEFLALVAASPVYALYGFPTLQSVAMPPLETPVIRDRMAYHIRRGMHDMLAGDWSLFMDFADQLWSRGKYAKP
ncbi:MAG TPA: alpha/beta hydrolase [Lacunisphaera sp.]|nr:alpha/beta hydrolase [Lacunisphaera sp.]